MQAGLELGGRYVLEQLLGQGGMGEVWRGTDHMLDRPVAVKVVRERLADEAQVARFQREARLAARLRHPGITVVYDIGAHLGRPFIVMELLEGHDLAETLQSAPNGLPVDAAVSLAIEVTEALRAAHASRIIHRDLKPANLFLQSSGGLKICDFGIARAADLTTNLTAQGQVIGTAYYMSPEQCEGRQVDERSDLYSLGCVLHELLTGKPPFPNGQPLAIMFQHISTAPVSLRVGRHNIPAELDRLVLELLAKDPGGRPPNAGSVAATLTALRVHGLTAAATPGDLTETRPSGANSHSHVRTLASGRRPGFTQSSEAPATVRAAPRTEPAGQHGVQTRASGRTDGDAVTPRRLRQPLTRGQRATLMALSIPFFPLALPAALVRISLDRSMTERTARTILVGYGILALIGTSIAEIIVNIHISHYNGVDVSSALLNDRTFVGLGGILLGAAYLTAGLRMRHIPEHEPRGHAA